MLIEVTNKTNGVDFAPADERAEIIQNVQTLISTARGTVAMYRDFGINAENLDLPLNIARVKLTAEIAQQLKTYEPRCTLKEVFYSGEITGELKAVIEVD